MSLDLLGPVPEKAVDAILKLLNKIGHDLGGWVVGFFETLLGSPLPPELEGPVGILVLLTAFLAAAEFSRKVLWYVVGAGWVILVARIALEVQKFW